MNSHPKTTGFPSSTAPRRIGALCGLLAALLSTAAVVHAGDQSTTISISQPDTRYGLFDLLDHRSSYGQGVFPEPFLVDDSDLEVNEARLDWLRTNAGDRSSRSDLFTAEVEKGFGQLTLELEVPFECDTIGGKTSQGMANIDVGARFPLYEYVSHSGFWDTTFGVAGEIGIPTHSSVSRNAEYVPKVFNDLKLGEHITLQSIFGYSMLTGPGEDGGLHTFEYGFTLGYTIPHKDLPIPGVQQLIPVFELSGEKTVNHDDTNSVLGNIAFRANMNTIGRIQPRLGLGFVFPMNNAARDDIHWGIVTSLVFEY